MGSRRSIFWQGRVFSFIEAPMKSMTRCVVPLTFACLLAFTLSGLGKSADYFPLPDKDGGWRSLNDPAQIRELAGMDAARLEQAFEFTRRCSQNGGLLVVRHGYLVLEKY